MQNRWMFIALRLGLLAIASSPCVMQTATQGDDPKSKSLPIPRTMPRLALFDLNTVRHDWVTMAGKVTLVHFWNTTLEGSSSLQSRLEAVVKATQSSAAEMFTVPMGLPLAEVQELAKKRKYSSVLLVDDNDCVARWTVPKSGGTYLVKDRQIIGQWFDKVRDSDVRSALLKALPAK